jgi:deoxyhypusine synthase
MTFKEPEDMARKSPNPAGDGSLSYPALDVQKKRRKRKLLARPQQALILTPEIGVADLVERMAGMSIQARNIGQCAQVLTRLYQDPKRPTVMLGLAGPLIAAGLRNVIRDLIVGGYVDVVVSTGAILYQDIYQARGFKHYQGTPNADDTLLRDLYIDRIYDTYVDEEKFWDTDRWCGRLADELGDVTLSSRAFMEYLGGKLKDENSIVYQCHRLGVPIFCPALNDSSIGIGLTHHRHRMMAQGRMGLVIDSIRDNYELTQMVVNSPGTAAIYIAGGVPKNYINDSVVMSYIFGLDRGHDYAIQLTTAVVHDGGLSSSTLGEAQSWGKIAGTATPAMAWVEPSVSLPLLAAYLLSRHPSPVRPRLRFAWKDGLLQSIIR